MANATKPAHTNPNAPEKHWSARSADDFAHALAFDFIAQLEQRFESGHTSQVAIAKKLGVSKSAVSKVLNNPENLGLKTIAKYSQAAGVKTAIVTYDDDDSNQSKGLIPGALFAECWVAMGRPSDAWSLEDSKKSHAGTTSIICVYFQQNPMRIFVNHNSGSNSSEKFIPLTPQMVAAVKAGG